MTDVVKQKKAKLLLALTILFFVLAYYNVSSFASGPEPEGDIFISTTSIETNTDDACSN